jgi:pimeloyl-ACP methyl ester carboxylesterase
MMPKKNHAKSRKIFIRESLKMNKEAFMKWIDYLSEIADSGVLIEKLKELPMKILFVSGDEDICFLSGTKKLAKEIHAEILTIAKCGHVCTIEKYREFNHMALEFLA